MWDPKSIAQHIKQKLSPQPPSQQEQVVGSEAGAAVDPLQTILKACRSLAESENDPTTLARAELAELVLTKILLPETRGASRIDHEAAKAYAFACGQMVGLIAALSLQSDTVEAAIDEVMVSAKANARGTVDILQKAGFKSEPLTPAAGGTSASAVSAADQKRQDQTTQTLEMIDSLEKQALQEKDP